jgi:hypothetical protein
LRCELIDPTVSANNGRVFKRTGDGVRDRAHNSPLFWVRPTGEALAQCCRVYMERDMAELGRIVSLAPHQLSAALSAWLGD